MSGADLRTEVHQPDGGVVLDRLVTEDVAAKLARQDPTLWGPEAESEASIRLGWVDLPRTSRPLLAQIDALRAELREEGLDHVVLAGMGGSSLAPEVIAATAGVELTVLDSTDPHMVRRALSDRLDRTIVVVSSKSGTTVETDSQRRAYLKAFADAGIDGARRIVVVTDPGSPLAELAEREGYRTVFLADPHVGGRFSALSAFGLVPAALAGVDPAELLDEAEAVMPALAASAPDNPGLALGAALGAAHEQGRNKVALGEGASPIRGFAAWAEQLIAESTGKDGRGLLPVDVGAARTSTPGWGDAGDDVIRVSIGAPDDAVPGQLVTEGSLGALFLLWETAVAVAGRVIGINPFDQPNVEEAKRAARALLDAPSGEAAAAEEPVFADGAVEVYADATLLGSARSLPDALQALTRAVPDRGYLAVLAYLDRVGDARAADLRGLLARGAAYPVTFGWGPRFLHSTGQYHKGGPPVGAFLQITGAVREDLAVPDRPYTFGQLIAAQAAGDLAVLRSKGAPTLRLHLTDRSTGLEQVLQAAERVRS
ncbi:glucose-6-phosphate isomerase [Thermasporomyces composti]|uniref:Glucose-6-phosphate isomerase n=1 Tax=Thermasporomyces composti TaxID=696763 RepID=A0A3D9VA39_THECX|nr:glucose-6-phosphate isomerase [Thermasporomyces composti]REF35014.1 glucose-6-phosphate isomerase [Thermasporomyces composti]